MKRAGYTLIEMSVVIIVLALIAAIALPNVASIAASSRVRKYRSDVRNLFGYARETAVTSGQKRTLVYSGEQLQVITESQDEAQVLRSVAPIDDLQVDDFFADGQSVGDAEWAVNFYPDGSADSGRFSLIEGQSATVFKVAPATGALQIVEVDAAENYEDELDKWPAGESISIG